jgi:hypothetical protein
VTTYLVFSDETGQYVESADEDFCRRYPYYVRSAVLLDVESWRKLKEEYFKLKTGKYSLPADKEIKWSYLWSLKKHFRNNEVIPEGREYSFLRGVSYEKLLSFVSDSCELMGQCTYCKIIFTVSFNNVSHVMHKASLLKMHLQDLMQRIEMEIQSNPDNLAILFLDSENQEMERLLRAAYREIYLADDFIREYAHIKDSILFELSHHSFGIQMADYTAGIFNGFLRGFNESSDLFLKFIYPLVRRDKSSGTILGYGITEIPKDANCRSALDNILPKHFD